MKTKNEMDKLWEIYKSLNGIPPSREVIGKLSTEMNLKENQIYKWFWDMKKKVQEDNVLARNMGISAGAIQEDDKDDITSCK